MLQKALSMFAASCDPKQGAGGFFGLPHWYEYLQGETDPITNKCIPKISDFKDFYAIGLAIVDILLVIGGLVAVAFVIYGGFQYMISQGEPDRTSAAKNTITNAIVGLVIVLLAIAVVSYIGNHF